MHWILDNIQRPVTVGPVRYMAWCMLYYSIYEILYTIYYVLYPLSDVPSREDTFTLFR